MICEEFGIASSTLYKWLRLYRTQGEEGLKRTETGGSSAGRIPVQVKELTGKPPAPHVVLLIDNNLDRRNDFAHL